MRFTQKDIQELLNPIAGELICGVYLKTDKSAFRPLRNEFNVAQTSLRKLSQNPSNQELEALQDENQQNWLTLSESLINIFRTTTRDIELIGWFLASQILLDDGFSATSYTLQWFVDLLENNWNEINPVLPEAKLKSDTESGQLSEQSEAKVKAFFQLLGDSEESSLLYAPLLLQPLIGTITFYDFQSAERKGEISQLKQQAASVVNLHRADIQQRLENVADCLSQIERLIAVTVKHCQSAAVNPPNINFIKALFTKYNTALQQLSNMKVEVKATTVNPRVEETPLVQDITMNEPVAIAPTLTQSISNAEPFRLTADNLSETGLANSMNRDLAFHLLREVSDYFRQSEPHSPVSFLLEKAIRWGYLSLPELLQEMMSEQDGDSVSKIFNAAGLNHLEQVLLPDVDVPPADIKKASVSTVNSSLSERVDPEVQASEVITDDAELKQNEGQTPTSSTALRW